MSENPPVCTTWARWFLPALLLVVALDQLSKWLIFALPPGAVLPHLLVRAVNTGVAWSIGNGHLPAVALLTLVLIPVLSWMWWRYFRALGPAENLACGMLLGGAVGNAIDRLLALFGWFGFTGVRDFISVDLGFWPCHPFPTFNLADSGITCGFILLLLMSSIRSAPTDARTQAAHHR